MVTLSSDASPEPQIIKIDYDSNEPTMPYWFGRQLPNIPTRLNNVNLPPNPFTIPATMAVAHATAEGHVEKHSLQSLKSSEPSPISTPPMNLSTIDGWETPHTTTDDNIFFSDDEPRRIYFLPSSPFSQLSPRKLKGKRSLGMSFSKKGIVAAHLGGL